MRSCAGEFKHADYVQEHKIVVIFEAGEGRAADLIDMLYAAGARITNMGYANSAQAKEMVNIMKSHNKMPS